MALVENIRDDAYSVTYKDTTVGEYLDRSTGGPYAYGAVGDGVTDDTLAVQAFFDNSAGDLNLEGGTFLVSKNPALAGTYPSEPDFSDGTYNFSPCLALVGKQGIKVHNGTIIVKTHGLDALSLVNCQNVTVSLNVQGPNRFPAIDTPTGYAEKGEAQFGYNSALVLAPNNALNTSTYSGGAYAGVTSQFPNYNPDGSQAAGWRSTWGTFLGGYIGSWASGIKVQRACRGILILDSTITGFNFAGIGIGIRNAALAYGYADYTVETDVPDGIQVQNTRISSCYQAGIYVLSGYRLNYSNCIINDIGHPDYNDTLNASYDPGYGITHGRNRRIRNVTVSGNHISRCVRKCIDFHGGGQAIITDNHCLEHGVVGIYAKCGVGWSPNYEPYNLIIANNYVRSRLIPPSETTGILAGAKYTRNIDVGGGGEATAATYPEPFVKVLSNYCELRAHDGTAINTGAGNSSYVVFRDIDISNNSVVLKYTETAGTSSPAKGIVVNEGASSSEVYRSQNVKLVGNNIKTFNKMDINYRSPGYTIQGIPKTLQVHACTLDMNVQAQSGLLCLFNLDSRTNYSFSGNMAVSTGTRYSCTFNEVMMYENVAIQRDAGAASLSIPGTLYRGIWQVCVAGSGDAFGARQVQFASTGSTGTGADIVRNPTTGFIANFGVGATGLTVPATTQSSRVQIQVKLISAFDSVA